MASNTTLRVFTTIAVIAGIVGGPWLLTTAAGSSSRSKEAAPDWPTYGGQPANDHYSPLNQINKSNVSKLKVAWTYDTGEDGGMETNPLVIDKVLFSYTPSQK